MKWAGGGLNASNHPQSRPTRFNGLLRWCCLTDRQHKISANGNRRLLAALMLAPVIVAPLTWRIGMTAPAPQLGPVLIQKLDSI